MRHHVGIVGAGQLALMMNQAAPLCDVDTTVLANAPTEPGALSAGAFMIGDGYDPLALRALSQATDVITFDHELVNLDALALLEQEGARVSPSSTSLRFAVNKAWQRANFSLAGLPVPRHYIVERASNGGVDEWIDALGGPVVVKAAGGGYDGRGVWFPSDADEAKALVAELTHEMDLVLEERLELFGEASQMLARDQWGGVALYPVVDTFQEDGMCVETHFPSALDAALCLEIDTLSRRIAELVAPVGVMAIEYFITSSGPVINEVALRPHNTGHWTIEGVWPSQFAHHLLCVSGQRVDAIDVRCPAAVMVNLTGGPTNVPLAESDPELGVYVHDYAKLWRPGRKLGHVTAYADTIELARVRAWKSARASGTKTKDQ
jgi:5-(carboxyamino)imidazole ribonucleotide synthase